MMQFLKDLDLSGDQFHLIRFPLVNRDFLDCHEDFVVLIEPFRHHAETAAPKELQFLAKDRFGDLDPVFGLFAELFRQGEFLIYSIIFFFTRVLVKRSFKEFKRFPSTWVLYRVFLGFIRVGVFDVVAAL